MKRKKVLIICPYPVGVAPSQRLKYEQYFEFIEENGFDVDVKPFIDTNFHKIVNRKGYYFMKLIYLIISYIKRIFTIFEIRKYDIVFIHLWVTPIGIPFFEFIYRFFSKKIIYDIDDLIFLSGSKSDYNPISNLVKGRKKPIYLMKKADHVITCTPYLDRFVRQWNPFTTDISSTINTSLYIPKMNYNIENKEVILGWSGSLSTSKYVKLLTGVFQKLNDLKISYKLVVMGDPNFSLEGVNVQAITWKEEYEVDQIKRFDIGLYPLPNTTWVLGKSSLKALQYMAAGVPTIATAIGTNFRIIDNNVNGILVTSEDEWVNAIVRLAKDKAFRKRIGQQGAKTVEDHYSVNANKYKYLAIFENLLKN